MLRQATAAVAGPQSLLVVAAAQVEGAVEVVEAYCFSPRLDNILIRQNGILIVVFSG